MKSHTALLIAAAQRPRVYDDHYRSVSRLEASIFFFLRFFVATKRLIDDTEIRGLIIGAWIIIDVSYASCAAGYDSSYRGNRSRPFSLSSECSIEQIDDPEIHLSRTDTNRRSRILTSSLYETEEKNSIKFIRNNGRGVRTSFKVFLFRFAQTRSHATSG